MDAKTLKAEFQAVHARLTRVEGALAALGSVAIALQATHPRPAAYREAVLQQLTQLMAKRDDPDALEAIVAVARMLGVAM